MAFVASFKNPLEIEGVFPPVFDGTGGVDEANDEGKPFSLLGIDSDNGSEFINKYLWNTVRNKSSASHGFQVLSTVESAPTL